LRPCAKDGGISSSQGLRQALQPGEAMRLLLVEDDLPSAWVQTALPAGVGHAGNCVRDGLAAEALLRFGPFERSILI
jgi:hypothetical protein